MKSFQFVHWQDHLAEVLQKVSLVTKVQVPEPHGNASKIVDAHVEILPDGSVWHLLVLEKTSGQPRYAREAAATLAGTVAKSGQRCHGVFVAPFISKQSQELLREAGLGWLDLAGNSRLSFGGIHIEITKTDQDPFTTRRSQQSLFAPKSARLLRLMLQAPGPWKVVDLSQRAGVSLGQVSNVRTLLLEKEWAQLDPNGGLRLHRPSVLLDAWREAVKPPKVLVRGHTLVHGKEMDTQLRLLFGRAELEKANVLLATHSVARRLAPFARIAGEFFYANDTGLDLLTRHFQLAPTDKGENITVLQAPDDGLWRDAMDRPAGMRSAGLIQTYLDLCGSGERGLEAADHFRRELIEPSLEKSL